MTQGNPDKNNINWQETKRLWFQAAGYMGILAMFICSAWLPSKLSKRSFAEYVVRAKGNQKIVYTPIDNPDEKHVMEFDTCRFDSLLYNAIRLGNTLGGDSHYLNQPIVPATYASSYGTGGRAYIIDCLNGKKISTKSMNQDATQAAIVAKRDSIIHAMCQEKVK